MKNSPRYYVHTYKPVPRSAISPVDIPPPMASSIGNDSAYSATQIHQFLAYINLPTDLRSAPPSQQLLSAIHSHTIARIPYENLSLHYSRTHEITLDPQFLFDKIVTRSNGRGGYCMEVAILYHHVLKGLGFNVYTAPAKNRNRIDGVPVGDWRSWYGMNSKLQFHDPWFANH